MSETTQMEINWRARRQRIVEQHRRTMVEYLREGRTASADGAMANDARVYTDEVRFQREFDVLFRDTPIVAGLSGDIAEPGSIMVFEELGQSILIARNKLGQVSAFLNMCTHRASKLLETCAKRNLITCPFHGWSFDLDGNLVSVPASEAFANLDLDTLGLVRVPCLEWGGLVFIKARPANGALGEDTIDIKAHLGEFSIELEQLELANAVPVKSGVLRANCNWKYALDTYGEGYHFPTLHKDTINTVSTTTSIYENFGRHHRIGWAPKRYLELLDKPEAEWPHVDFGAVHYLFPNTILFIGAVTDGDVYVQIFRHFPDSVGQMHTKFDVYAPHGIPSDAYREEVVAGFDGTAHVVDKEDYWVARNGWERLRDAPEGFKVYYGANEIALQEQHKNIAEAIGMPLDVYS